VIRDSLAELKHFLTPKGVENASRQGKKIDELKRAETLALLLLDCCSFKLKLFSRIGLKPFLPKSH